MGWGANDIERLRALAAEGLSASQIARQFSGVSRNAVIGKLTRNGIPLARQHGHRTLHEPRPEPPLPPEPEPVRAPEPVPEPVCDPVSTLDLKRGACKWPVGDGVPEWLHCGAPAPHGPYCSDHRTRAFSQSHKRDAA